MRILYIESTKVALLPIGDRLFELSEDVICAIHTNEGTLRYRIAKGFKLDARSGGKAVDWVVPWTGTQAQILAWLIHDAGFYGTVTFKVANDLLRQMLLMSGLSSWKVALVHKSVSWFGGSHYSQWDDEITDPVYKNNRQLIDFNWCAS